jgi:hypothetical protein
MAARQEPQNVGMCNKSTKQQNKTENPETEMSFSSLSSFLAISKNSIFNARITQYPRFL